MELAREDSDRFEASSAWRLDSFVASLTSASANTVAAYSADVLAFVEWAARADVVDPGRVDRLLLRRYVAALTTRRYAKRSVARKVAALRRYFSYLRREGVLAVDPSVALRAPAGEGRLPRVLDQATLHTLWCARQRTVRPRHRFARSRRRGGGGLGQGLQATPSAAQRARGGRTTRVVGHSPRGGASHCRVHVVRQRAGQSTGAT